MNRNVIVMVILALLLLVSIAQAVQLTTLKAKVDAGAVKVSGAKTSTASAPSGNSGVGGIESLPTMVGGC